METIGDSCFNMPKYLCKFRALSSLKDLDRVVDIIENNRLFFPNYVQLNDPLDGSATDIKLAGYAGCTMHEVLDEEDPRVKAVKMNYRILSLTSDDLSPQMWAFYGGNYTGICLCYRTTGKFGAAKLVEYDNERPKRVGEEYDDDRISEIIERDFMRKQGGWSYEKEWRIIKNSSSLFFEYAHNDLACVVFGYNADPFAERVVRQFIPNSVRILKAFPGMRTYKNYLTEIDYEKAYDGSPVPKVSVIDYI